VNQAQVQAARIAWMTTKGKIALKEISRKIAVGGNRRIKGRKSQSHETFTSTMDMRGRPFRHLYSRVQAQDRITTQCNKGENPYHKRKSDGFEDIWTRLSDPVLSSGLRTHFLYILEGMRFLCAETDFIEIQGGMRS